MCKGKRTVDKEQKRRKLYQSPLIGVYVPSNTTVILDRVLFVLRYVFRPLLGHHQAILEVCYLGTLLLYPIYQDNVPPE
jgi:hypothetical protein